MPHFPNSHLSTPSAAGLMVMYRQTAVISFPFSVFALNGLFHMGIFFFHMGRNSQATPAAHSQSRAVAEHRATPKALGFCFRYHSESKARHRMHMNQQTPPSSGCSSCQPHSGPVPSVSHGPTMGKARGTQSSTSGFSHRRFIAALWTHTGDETRP